MISSQVTKELCQEIVSKRLAVRYAEVVEFHVKELKKTAFADEFVLSVMVQDCKDAEFSFILKTPSNDHPDQFLKESMVYSSLPLEQKISAPCFYSNKNMIVLENLTNSGFQSYGERSFDDVHIKIALRKLAELHALAHLDHIQQSKPDIAFLRSAFEKLLEEAKKFQLETPKASVVEKDLSMLYEEMISNLAPSKDFMNVINHGDLRRENLLFLYRDGVPVDCKLINFYFAQHCLPANDVLLFLLNVTTVDERKEHFREYLEYYYYCFSMCCGNKNILQWDEFDLSCKILLPTAKLRNACHSLEQGSNIVAGLENMLMNRIVSEEDCFTVLNTRLETTDYVFQSFNVNRVPERSGFLGDHFTLTTNILSKLGKRQLHFFVKTIPSAPSQIEFGMSSGAFFKEHRMFTKLVPLLQKYKISILGDVIPKAYLCILNDVIVQEDLVEQGFVKLNSQLSLGFEEVKMVLKSLAKFHAAFIILEERISRERGYTYRLNEDFEKEFKEIFFDNKRQPAADGMNAVKTGARASVDAFYSEGKLEKETFCELLETALDRLEDEVKASKRFRNSIGHGDLWINNMLFKYEDGLVKGCRIIDFQSYRYLPPAHDVLTTIYLTTDRKYREKYLTESLHMYFDVLSETFSKHDVYNVITKQEFEESCRFYKESALCQTLGHFQAIMIPTDVSNYLFENPEELRKVFFSEKYEFMMKTFAEDPNFRRRNKDSLLDIVEHFESLYGD